MIDFRRISVLEERDELKRLLSSVQLELPENTDDNIGMYDDGKLIGCGFLKGDMLQGIAVDEKYQGEGVAARLMTELIKLALRHGRIHIYIITKCSMAEKFTGFGLRMIAESRPDAAFLEFGSNQAGKFGKKLKQIAQDKPDKSSAIVMNCNPFTKGHRYLIQQASKNSDWVYVIVVEEEQSEFSFCDRFNMVQLGTCDLPNVTVISGGRYAISSLTFPAYFTKKENTAKVQCRLDAEVFANIFVPNLKITKRYIGEEPIDKVTGFYNEVLKNKLPARGIEVIEVPRYKEGDDIVSASAVRSALKVKDEDKIRRLVPKSTLEYLKTKWI